MLRDPLLQFGERVGIRLRITSVITRRPRAGTTVHSYLALRPLARRKSVRYAEYFQRSNQATRSGSETPSYTGKTIWRDYCSRIVIGRYSREYIIADKR